jgi:hypothetical protein
LSCQKAPRDCGVPAARVEAIAYFFARTLGNKTFGAIRKRHIRVKEMEKDLCHR